MKTNKLTKKIIVSTLAVAMGAALVGSISGTVAWYQYSTRVTAQMSGTSAGTSRNLQIASDAAVVSDEHNAAWDYNVAPAKKADMAPSTVEITDGVVSDFYEHPVYQYFTSWKEADANDYFSYDLYFQSLKQGNVREAVDVYLTAFELKDNSGNDLTGIIAEALRIEMAVYTTADGSAWTKQSSKILSKTAGTTETSDYLNLNNRDGGTNFNMDHNGFLADDSDGVATKYQAGTSTSYTTVAPTTLLADDTDPYAFSGGEVLFSTATNFAVKMSVKVWIEGWQKTETNPQVSVPEGTDATGYYSDAECASAIANNYHSVTGSIGDDGAGLYSDTGCTTPAEVDAEGHLTAAGTYYKKGLAAGSYYTKGYIWDDASIGTNFNINMRFGCEADR